MRRLLVLSALLVAVHAPVGWASPPSVAGEIEECYDLQTEIPPVPPLSQPARVCQPVIHVPPTDI